MKLDYVVHSAHETTFPVTAKLGDRDVEARVPGLVVELVDGDRHGHTFRFAPATDEKHAANKALFVTGARITATFAATPEGDAQ